jgi:transposase
VYPDEFRERAVRLVREWRDARGVSEGGLTAVSDQLGLRRETLRRWVIEDEVEDGSRPGLSREERSRIAELERENRELRRANEILKTAAACVSRMRGRKRCRRSNRPSSAAREMEVGPPQPPCRRRLQTTARCAGQEPGC